MKVLDWTGILTKVLNEVWLTPIAMVSNDTENPLTTEPTLRKVIPVGSHGLLVKAIKDDISKIMSFFTSRESKSFRTCAQIWGKMNFAFIHYGCLDIPSREDFVNALFLATFEHFDGDDILVKLGVLYNLYMIYITQPVGLERHRIRLTTEMWKQLYNFYRFCIEEELSEAALLFELLYLQNAFLITAFIPIDLSQTNDPTQHNMNNFITGLRSQYAQIDLQLHEHDITASNQLQDITLNPELKSGWQNYLEQKRSLEKNFPLLDEIMFLNNLKSHRHLPGFNDEIDVDDTHSTLQFKSSEYSATPLSMVTERDDVIADLASVVSEYYENLENLFGEGSRGNVQQDFDEPT